jgi:hypothetical protein
MLSAGSRRSAPRAIPIKKIVPWEEFRPDIEGVTETKPEERKSNAGRKPYDAILKFKIVVLHSGTRAATVRSAKTEIAQSRYCSRCPRARTLH